jgi:hypothetical protein
LANKQNKQNGDNFQLYLPAFRLTWAGSTGYCRMLCDAVQFGKQTKQTKWRQFSVIFANISVDMGWIYRLLPYVVTPYSLANKQNKQSGDSFQLYLPIFRLTWAGSTGYCRMLCDAVQFGKQTKQTKWRQFSVIFASISVDMGWIYRLLSYVV